MKSGFVQGSLVTASVCVGIEDLDLLLLRGPLNLELHRNLLLLI